MSHSTSESGTPSATTGDSPQPEKTSDRYEFGELFSSEGGDTQHFLMVCGVIILLVLLGVFLGWPFKYL